MTVSLLELWLHIVVGTALAWVASGLIHMALKYHSSDYQKLANEDDVTAVVRQGSPGIGIFHFPHCPDMADMKNESMQKKFIDGPVGFLTIFPRGLPQMGKLMVQQISFFLTGCVLIAYSATLVLAPGAEYMSVFRFVSTIGFLAFGWAQIPMSIWFGHLWSTTAKYLLDALIYALVIAGSFAWLWPTAA